MSKSKEPITERRRVPFELPGLPAGWSWSTVEGIAKAGEQPVLTGPFGSSLGKNDFISIGVPLLTIGCLTESGISLQKAFYISTEKAEALARYRVRQGDMLFSRSASVGRAGLVTESLAGSVINYHLMRLRLEPSLIDPRFFIYFVRGSSVVTAYLREVNHGATRDGINTNDLLAMPVPVAPPNTQRHIVAKIEELFSDLDAGVAALERAKANLKRYRAAVLKAAAEGKLTEEWRESHPDTEPASKLLERILAERRRKWEADQLAKLGAAGKQPPRNWRAKYIEPTPPDTTGLPKLPAGWCWATVEQLIIRSEYGTSVKCDYEGNGPPVLRIPNIAAGRLDLQDLKFSTQAFALTSDDCLLPGDMLMCRTNGSISLIGKAAIVRDELSRPYSFASYLLRFRLAAYKVLPQWVHSFVCSSPGRRFIERHAASSAGQHNISLSLIHRMPVPLPPMAEQDKALENLEQRLSVIVANEAALEHALVRASRLRQTILKQAFEGKLVPQDPSDEPASILLHRLQRNRSVHKGITSRASQARTR